MESELQLRATKGSNIIQHLTWTYLAHILLVQGVWPPLCSGSCSEVGAAILRLTKYDNGFGIWLCFLHFNLHELGITNTPIAAGIPTVRAIAEVALPSSTFPNSSNVAQWFSVGLPSGNSIWTSWCKSTISCDEKGWGTGITKTTSFATNITTMFFFLKKKRWSIRLVHTMLKVCSAI